MTNNSRLNVIEFHHPNSPHSRLPRSAIAASRPMKPLAGQIGEGDQDYRYRMFASALVAAFVGMLVISGQWMFTILVKMP